MERDKEFRRVNPILDARPRFGPIPADLILPWAPIGIVFYMIFHGMLQLEYLWTILLIGWSCGTWWILTGSKPHQFLSKFIREPHWCRGYVRYQTIAQTQNHSPVKRSKKRSRKQTS